MTLFLALVACEPGEEAQGPGACEIASDRVGATVCVEQLDDEATWMAMSKDAEVVDQDRTVKYLVPVDEEEPVPTAFVNSQRYALHYDFLREAFPESYGMLQWDEYVAMIIDPSLRAYYGGNVGEYIESGGSTRFGFIVWDDPEDPATMPTYDDVLATWRALQPAFGLGELMFVPWSKNQQEAAEHWDDAPFAIRFDDSVTYEAYNPGYGYGTLRFLALADLDEAEQNGEFGWQDIVVLDEAPLDLERVVSGVVTGTRQAALSHLNVRMAARGTPNCYIPEPWTHLAAWEGQLVRFECGETGYTVAAADAEDAEEWWEQLRPDPVSIPEADLEWNEVTGLLDVPTDSSAEREAALSRYGSKGSNLATLYQRIPRDYRLDGFVVPFAWYDRFMRENTWEAEVAGGTASLSFADTIRVWHADEAFLSDPTLRNGRLEALRAAMLAAPVDPEDLDAIALVLVDIFAGDDTMVRVRSSSNAEDGLDFSGAGLYTSASACLADDRDADIEGPSACDDDKSREHTLEDALRISWASLWNAGAWEERAWYGVDPLAVAMAILVDTQSEDEQANMVAFTGNPLSDDEGWLVESQVGDTDVVAAEAGVSPERVLLLVEDGEVTDVERIAESSELPAGEEVLSDAQLGEVGALLWEVDAVMPVDFDVDGRTWMWDTEQKILEDGRLIIKQVRPFSAD